MLMATAILIAGPALEAAGAVTISLRDSAVTAAQSQITIGDVAELSGGTTSDRQRIAALDLDSLGHGAQSCRITRRQVQLRVMVDGYTRRQFEVIGRPEVAVRCSTAKQLRARLEQLFTDEICRQFGLAADSVSVRVSNSQQVSHAESKLASDDFKATVLFPPQLPLGRTKIDVEFEIGGDDRFLASLDVHVIVSMQVAVATVGIAKGTTIDRNMVRWVTRPILSRENFAQPNHVVGRVAKRDIYSNEVVLSNALENAPTSRQPVVKRNDLLDVIVKLGRNEVRLKNAKALSPGNIGESILLLNTRSNQRLTATVVSRNLASMSTISRGPR